MILDEISKLRMTNEIAKHSLTFSNRSFQLNFLTKEKAKRFLSGKTSKKILERASEQTVYGKLWNDDKANRKIKMLKARGNFPNHSFIPGKARHLTRHAKQVHSAVMPLR